MAASLNKDPLYCQVADALAARIAGGTWKPGTCLPSEIDLARQMHVSPGTMRKALDKLEADHLIRRVQGRGTFVEDPAAQESAARFDLLRSRSGAALAASSTVLSQGRYPADGHEIERLSLSPGDQVLRTVRRRTHNGRPFMHEHAALALPRLPSIGNDGPGDYALAALAQENGILPSRATEQVTVCPADGAAAESLGIARGTMVLRLDRIVISFGNQPIEWRIALCHLLDEYYAVSIG